MIPTWLSKTAIVLIGICLIVSGCAAPNIKLFPDATDPLKEFILSGTASEKVLILPVKGVLTDEPKERLVHTEPSAVEEIVSQLRLAEKDDDIRTVLLKIDSPGGTATASDLLYHELTAFRERSGKKIVAVMMDVAASGGYYVALSADHIMAHPTTITGSVGVVLMRPDVTGLMGKIGVDVAISKSGKNKDMGSPFRPSTPEEEQILQALIDSLGERFTRLVAERRSIDAEGLENVSTARVYLADEALELGLIDAIGYLPDAVEKAKQIAGLPPDARVVVYRRTENPNDTVYHTAATGPAPLKVSLTDLGLSDSVFMLKPGFYYIWPFAIAK